MDWRESETYIGDLDIALNHVVNIQKLKNSKILITGATGTIGSFVADLLLRYSEVSDAGLSIQVTGRDTDRLEKWYPKSTCLFYDIYKDIEFDVDVDYIIHAAGNAHPAAFNGDPVGTIIGNIMGTYHLLEYGRKHRAKRLLFVSSGEIYGQGDLSLDEFEETYLGYLNLLSPRSCYPSSKRTAENLCASYSGQYGFETVIARLCHTYGPCITPSDNRASAQFIRDALNERDIVMKSPGTQRRSYNYIADCASALITVLINGNSGEAYNIANPEVRISIAELAEVVAGTTGQKVVFSAPDSVDFANRTPIARQVLSGKKLEALGWSGAFTAEEGISHTIDILRGK